MDQGPVIFKNSDDLGPGRPWLGLIYSEIIGLTGSKPTKMISGSQCIAALRHLKVLHSLDFLVFYMYSNYL